MIFNSIIAGSNNGGAENFVHGEFSTNSVAGTQDISIPYTGNGYPIMAYVCIKGGAQNTNTNWYTLIRRYAVGIWTMSKRDFTSAPTYTNISDTINQAVTMTMYKSSSGSSTSFGRSGAVNSDVYTINGAHNSSAYDVVKFKSNTNMSVYIDTTGTLYGLVNSTDYEYFVVYSE